MSVSHSSHTDETMAAESDERAIDRLVANPRPALKWIGVGAVLLAVEFGAVAHLLGELLQVIVTTIPGSPAAETVTWLTWHADRIPTVLSRNTIPNQGYWNGSRWVGTFFGQSPAISWAIRAVAVYGYAALWLVVLWKSYQTYRSTYRVASWTPNDDRLDRFRKNSWGMFGFLTVSLFLVMALFAPALGPTTMEANIQDPYSHQITYWDSELGDTATISVGSANLMSNSKGTESSNVGPLQYDDLGRFHPLGTLTNGKDMCTVIVHGARITLFIGVLAIGLAGSLAALLAMASAYYKGLFDLLIVVSSDSVQSLPAIMLLISASVVLSNTWIARLYNGALILALLLALVYWPSLWRAIRGPAFQVAQEEWVDAAKSYGQSPLRVMEKHMLPYVLGYLLVYCSMNFAGVIVSVAGLSFIGIGIQAPTPSWGRAIDLGQPYVASASWHISLVPGILITLIAVGFNAFGDGIRDAIDPESEAGTEEGTAAGGA